nr:YolD-like family protein [Paenibacillus camelliae]
MLPEHKQMYEDYVASLDCRERIELDEQEVEQISRALQQSMQYKVPLSIRMYDPFERVQVIGVVENISKRYGQYKVNGDWFSVDDIEGIEVDNEPC